MIDLFGAWTSGDLSAQEEQGYQDGLKFAESGGWPDGDIDTPYNRGMLRATREYERQRRIDREEGI
jgi:hypothetical protein